jgi:hypothetical protein
LSSFDIYAASDKSFSNTDPSQLHLKLDATVTTPSYEHLTRNSSSHNQLSRNTPPTQVFHTAPTTSNLHSTRPSLTDSSTSQSNHHVLPLRRRPPPAHIRREDRSRRDRSRNDLRYVQSVRIPFPHLIPMPMPILIPSLINSLPSPPIFPHQAITPVHPPHHLHYLTHPQPNTILHPKMHPRRLPRSGPEQRRIRLPGPLCRQILRGERQSLGEDAGGGCYEAGWGGGRDVWCVEQRIRDTRSRRGWDSRWCEQ